jgi:hypothetical protein
MEATIGLDVPQPMKIKTEKSVNPRIKARIIVLLTSLVYENKYITWMKK